MSNNPDNEYGKGYKALDILVILSYIGCLIYLALGVIAVTKAVLAGLVIIFGGIIGFIGVYVVDKIGRSVFIARDIALDQKRKDALN